MPRPRVYIAGPITLGSKNYNLYQFMQAHEILMDFGFAVFNPGLTALLPWERDKYHEEWLDCCLPWVESADLLVRLPGRSKGADMEVDHAIKHGVPVRTFDSLEALDSSIWDGDFDEFLNPPARVNQHQDSQEAEG